MENTRLLSEQKDRMIDHINSALFLLHYFDSKDFSWAVVEIHRVLINLRLPTEINSSLTMSFAIHL